MFFRRTQSPTLQPPTLRTDLRQTRRSARRLCWCVLMLVSGVTPATCLWWNQADWTAANRLQLLSSTILQTYPLTLSVAVITLARRRRWFGWGRWLFSASVIVGVASFSNATANMFRDAATLIPTNGLFEPRSGVVRGTVVASLNTLAGYYQMYGAGYFLASLITGRFVGATIARFWTHGHFELAKKIVTEVTRERAAA